MITESFLFAFIFYMWLSLSLSRSLSLSLSLSLTLSLSLSLSLSLPPSLQVRWKVAWEGIVSKGWVTFNREIGYQTTTESHVMENLSIQVSEQRQWVGISTYYPCLTKLYRHVSQFLSNSSLPSYLTHLPSFLRNVIWLIGVVKQYVSTR